MRWMIIALMVMLMAVNVVSAADVIGKEDKTEWKDNCQVQCNNGKCNTILGRTVWVNDSDNSCREIEKAKSLKRGFYVEETERDYRYAFEIIDYNYTCITVIPKINDVSVTNTDIPLKINGMTIGTIRYVGLLSKPKTIELCRTHNGLLITDKDTLLKWTDQRKWPSSVLAMNFTFGSSSTTIILQDADTENLEDTYIQSNDEDTDRGTCNPIQFYLTSSVHSIMFKFNISELLPISPEAVESSILYIYASSNGFDSGDVLTITPYHVYQNFSIGGGSWVEGNLCSASGCSGSELCYGTRPTSGYYNENNESCYLADSTTAGYIPFSVTMMTGVEHSATQKTLSIWLIPNLVSGTANIGDLLKIESKENGDPLYMPYLNITYSEGEEPPAGDCWTFSSGVLTIPPLCKRDIEAGVKA